MRVQLQRRALVWGLAACLLFAAGCKKKKPQVPPAQAQAPTIEQPAQQTQPTTTTPPQPAPEQPESTTPQTTTPPPEKPSPSKPKKSASTHHHAPSTNAKKSAPAPANPPANEVAKSSIPASEASIGQISPDMSRTVQSQTEQSTSQLLESTEKDLRNLTRRLNNDEQNTVTQIKNYITQARAALKDQDLERAHNLALKAHQLCDVLVKQ
jgi:gas vesicle protein